jgi:predicted Zn-dependent peptidase
MTGSGPPAVDAPLVHLPPLGPPPGNLLPSLADRVTSTGLRVVVACRPGIPLVEIRLCVPVSCAEVPGTADSWLLAACMLSGRPSEERGTIAELIENLGAELTASADSDQLIVRGTVLASCLEELLELLVAALVAARYDEDDVVIERARLVARLKMARSRASVRAGEILRAHLFGPHPYARSLPQAADVAEVTRAGLLALHERRVVPRGSVLVLVGDLDPESAVTVAERALSGWDRHSEPAQQVPAWPTVASASTSRLIHVEDSVQSSIRIGAPALRRHHPEYAALQLANLLYGGYFSGRLIQNIREDKGYCYSPCSKIEHWAAGGMLIAEADVTTAYTAPAFLEMWYELGKLSVLRPTDDEVNSARQFATGSLAMSMATQAGLATTLAMLLRDGLDPGWVREYPRQLAQVTARDVYDLSVHLLAPSLLTAVVIGDASRCEEPLRALGPWEVE